MAPGCIDDDFQNLAHRPRVAFKKSPKVRAGGKSADKRYYVVVDGAATAARVRRRRYRRTVRRTRKTISRLNRKSSARYSYSLPVSGEHAKNRSSHYKFTTASLDFPVLI
jgi:hypothetical protein